MILVTRYALVSRGEKESNDELKAWLLGSDKPCSSTLTGKWKLVYASTVTWFSLGVMSASGPIISMSAKMFPWRQKRPESVK